MKILIVILCLTFIPFKALSCETDDLLLYKKKWTDSTGSWIDRYWKHDVCFPKGCSTMKTIEKKPESYEIKDKKKLKSLLKRCKYHKAGKTIKDSISKGKKILEDSAAGSFLKGLLGK